MQRDQREHRGDDEADVPAHPLVQVEIDLAGGVLVNGRPEAHDIAARHAEAPRELALVAVQAVARDYARPLGRPVRVLATTPEEQTRMLVHPDAHVSGVQPHLASATAGTPEGVPPATRAQHWLAAREADRAAEQADQRRNREGRRRARPLLVGAAALVAVGVGTAWALGVGGPFDSEDPTPAAVGEPLPDAAQDGDEGAPAPAEPEQPDPAESTPRPEPRALTGVRASATPGEVRLALRSTRGTPVLVALAPASAPGGGSATAAAAQRLDLSLRRATTREVVITDLPPGAWVWTVRAPGQDVLRGRVQVPAPQPEVVPVDDLTTPQPPVPAEPPSTPSPPPSPPDDDDGEGEGRRPAVGGGLVGSPSEVPVPAGPQDPRP